MFVVYLNFQLRYIMLPVICLATVNTPVCDNISSRFSSNSEADASELLENLEEMFPWYYIYI